MSGGPLDWEWGEAKSPTRKPGVMGHPEFLSGFIVRVTRPIDLDLWFGSTRQVLPPVSYLPFFGHIAPNTKIENNSINAP
jgi:hypothetical protein